MPNRSSGLVDECRWIRHTVTTVTQRHSPETTMQTAPTIDDQTRESYASMSTDEIIGELCYYSDEFENAGNATKRMMALDDMRLFQSLLDDRRAAA